MPDQTKLISLSWATLHLIDYTYNILSDKLPKTLCLSNGMRFDFYLNKNDKFTFFSVESSFLALLGCVELESEWKQLCNQLRQFQINEYDYTAFMCLSIFNSEGKSNKSIHYNGSLF